MPPAGISIQTGARLHYGPLSYHTPGGRHFGGIGMMVRQPGVRLQVELAEGKADEVTGSHRAARMLTELRARSTRRLVPCRVKVEEEIPSHLGLGSGTQLGLAVAEALAVMSGESIPLSELSALGGRGERSSIGTFGYAEGGFLVDAGHRDPSEPGTLACRLPFPEEWRVLLLIPPSAQGLHGREEMEVFTRLPPLSEEISGRLSRLVLTEILPAISGRNFGDFCAALNEYGRRVGEFFADCQGGVFASASVAEVAKTLMWEGVSGLAQSSWGPAMAVMARSEEHATEIRDLLARSPAGHGFDVRITRALNTGRTLTTV